MSDNKTWAVVSCKVGGPSGVDASKLAEALNKLADDGYMIFKILEPDADTALVVAYDPVQQTKSLHNMMAENAKGVQDILSKVTHK